MNQGQKAVYLPVTPLPLLVRPEALRHRLTTVLPIYSEIIKNNITAILKKKQRSLSYKYFSIM